MSHRALVGYVDADSKVDLYFSRNGANQLKLYPILEAAAAAGHPRKPLGATEPPDGITDEIAELRSQFDATARNEPLIETEPHIEGCPRGDVGERINYIDIEAVFLLEDEDASSSAHPSIDVFLPVFVDVTILLFFMYYVTFEVYSRDDTQSNPGEAIEQIRDGSIKPRHAIKGREYLKFGDVPAVKEHFIESHCGLLQAIISSAGRSPQETLGIVMTDEAYLAAHIEQADDLVVPEAVGRGILVQLPTADFAYQQLVSLYSDWDYLAKRLRIEHSEAMTTQVLKAKLESAVEANKEPFENDLLSDLADEFRADISNLSPPPYLDRIPNDG